MAHDRARACTYSSHRNPAIAFTATAADQSTRHADDGPDHTVMPGRRQRRNWNGVLLILGRAAPVGRVTISSAGVTPDVGDGRTLVLTPATSEERTERSSSEGCS
jgi:hypothetical protein